MICCQIKIGQRISFTSSSKTEKWMTIRVFVLCYGEDKFKVLWTALVRGGMNRELYVKIKI